MGGGASIPADSLSGMTAEEVAEIVVRIGPAYSKYSSAIVDNGLDGSVLSELAPEELDEALSEIGLSTLHRKVCVRNLGQLITGYFADLTPAEPSSSAGIGVEVDGKDGGGEDGGGGDLKMKASHMEAPTMEAPSLGSFPDDSAASAIAEDALKEAGNLAGGLAGKAVDAVPRSYLSAAGDAASAAGSAQLEPRSTRSPKR